MGQGIVESSQGSSQGASRSKLVQRLLGASTNLETFLNDLLGTMAVVVAGTEAAGFLLMREGDQMGLRPICHIRPDESDAATRQAAIRAFQEIIQPCILQNKDGAIEVGSPDEGEPQFCLVTLLRSEGQVVAAAAVITRCRDQERAKQRLQSMQLVAGYFELYTMRRAADASRIVASNHQNVLQLAAALGTADGFESGAMNLCNELANRTGATRVSLGWVRGRAIKVRALSHTEKFDKKQELIIQLQRAMEECADQEEPVRYDFDGQRSDNVTRDAEVLSRAQGGNSVFSLPLRRRDEVVGVVTLEFAQPYKMTQQTADALIVAADVLSSQIYDRHENDRFILVKVGHSIRDGAKLVMGPKHMVAKLVIMLVIGAGLFVGLYKPMYHVSAPFQLAPIDKQYICVPYDGLIAHVELNPHTRQKYKAGDSVRQGDVLVVMDTTELWKKLEKSQADQKEAAARKLKAQADAQNEPSKIPDANIAEQQEISAAKEAAIYMTRINQANITAPFSGTLIQGDLEGKAGTPMKLGETLFEMAVQGRLRAELMVAERDIQELHIDQEGTLSTNGRTTDGFKFKIRNIVPMGNPKDGDNTFLVQADLLEKAEWMRAGMEGEARVNIEPRRLFWIWTHRLFDFLRLKLWM